MRPRSTRIPQSGAPTLQVRESGEGDRTLVLIHGFGDGGYIWDDFLPILGAHARAVTVDLRGHGDSDWDPHARYDIAAYLDDIASVLNALHLRRVALVGHSMGGEIAIRLTDLYPDRVAGLILVDAGPELEQSAVAHVRREFVADNRIYSSYSEYADRLKERQPLIAMELAERLARNALRPRIQGGLELKRDPSILIQRRSALPKLWPMLDKIACPTQVMRGAGSAVLPISVAKQMLARLRYGRLDSVTMAGHAIMIDNPPGFAAAAISFISEALLPNCC
ncbi:alpha/beta hydrolase [Bradyrhizobium sp. SZCCHNRI30512]|uniref:alpha/beta hydrolase n=1 Tax=unclassified Bradyrhizobium TaxID=2631580 RepID=UPI003966C3CE